MVTRVRHGGQCCGAGHIYGFGDAENRDPDLIDRALALSPTGQHNNVMLNLDQMRTYPNVLQRLADRGFVLDGHFINDNHGSHVFSFSRADKRHKITRDALAALDINWPGMILTPDLHGDMPAMPAGLTTPVEGHRFRIGQRCRVIAGREVHGGYREITVGLEGVVTRCDGSVTTLTWEFPHPVPVGAHENSAVFTRALEAVGAAMAENVPPAIPEMRHRTDEGPAPVNRVTVVASLYANRYRTTGRSNVRYGSYEAAERGRKATAVATDRLDIMSDGTEIWVEGVQE